MGRGGVLRSGDDRAGPDKSHRPAADVQHVSGHVHSVSELEAYTKKAIQQKLTDQQVRDIELGRAHVGIGMVYRSKLDKPAPDSVAEHDLVSEVYHVISGSATLVLGPDIVNRQRRPATLQTVIEYNGPGHNGSEIRNGVAHQLKAGDVVVIPAGTGTGLPRSTITSTT